MAISVKQEAKNSTAYLTTPLVVTLPTGTTAGSLVAVVVEGLKSGYPYPFGSLNANTPNPVVTDDQGNTYTLVDSIVNQTQEVLSSPPVQSPDASGHFPSVYVFVSSGAATAGTQNISVSAFYPDQITSPPMVKGARPVFNGGTHAQVFEIAGLASKAVDVHAHVANNNVALGQSLVTTSGGALILEAGILMDSASLITAGTPTVPQFSGTLYSGSTHFVVQSTIVTTATQSSGFANTLKYTGGVVTVAVK